MDRETKCGRCRFWGRTSKRDRRNTQLGECRRHTPQWDSGYDELRGEGIDVCDARWPLTKSVHWCGEGETGT